MCDRVHKWDERQTAKQLEVELLFMKRKRIITAFLIMQIDISPSTRLSSLHLVDEQWGIF